MGVRQRKAAEMAQAWKRFLLDNEKNEKEKARLQRRKKHIEKATNQRKKKEEAETGIVIKYTSGKLKLSYHCPRRRWKAPKQPGHLLFSCRFGDGTFEQLAREVHEALEQTFHMNTFMVDANIMGEFGEQTMYALAEAAGMLSFSCETYGARTGSKSCSFYEVEYCHQHEVPIVPLQLCDTFPAKPEDTILNPYNRRDSGRNQNKCVFLPSQVLLDCRGLSAEVISRKVYDYLLGLHCDWPLSVL